MPYNLAVAIPTLVGSLLSFVATSCVLISYIVYADQQRSFRHALVLNLALAEFINSLNNSISGIYAIVNKGSITLGPACSLNGWVGQWSVQAADFSILAIAIITLLTITRKTYMPNASLMMKIAICGSVWLIPTITATTAAGLKEITPVSGNWCWISGERPDLRYILGHGWRFSIIFGTIGIYIYIWIYMKRHFTKMHVLSKGRSYNQGSAAKRREFRRDDAIELRSESQTELHEINVEYGYEVKHSDGRSTTSTGKDEMSSSAVELERDGSHRSEVMLSPTSPKTIYDKGGPDPYPPHNAKRNIATIMTPGPATEGSGVHQSGNQQSSGGMSRNVEYEIKKMLLLNAYPVLYIILWLPGILNRLVEAAGSSSYPLTILQCSTQYIGLANAITYGFNEHLKTMVKGDFIKWCKTRRG
ncbi:glucose receptor git3 protein [Stemphylium lycopersici]|uniref:Glucose receptor git3 protein n=1 Tax=Stemphylium lycopersici TaxID=183478 RepID=A0A364NG68_STELY|nr:glucose receptor git3 protein [Stemphylium lycopersici]RAR05095.1 glucose receptor git3 protein [Stemphylium lycopersici]RAR16279.1 glucose receptor git3 protein [Stemphylium lycopersici]